MPVAVPTRHSGSKPPDRTKREVCDANNEYHTNPPICWSKELCWWLLNEFSTTMGVFSLFSMPSDWSLEKFGESHTTNPPCQKRAPNFQLPFTFHIFWSCYPLVHWEWWLQWSYLQIWPETTLLQSCLSNQVHLLCSLRALEWQDDIWGGENPKRY